MSAASFRPRTLFFPLDQRDWAGLHAIRDSLPRASEPRLRLQSILDGLQARANDRFAMVVWSAADVCVAIGKLRGLAVDYGDEPPRSDVGVRRATVDDVMAGAGDLMQDAMTIQGWEVLGDYVAEHVSARAPTRLRRPR